MRRPGVAKGTFATVVLALVVNLATETIKLPSWSNWLVWSSFIALALYVVFFEMRRNSPPPADDTTTDRDRLLEVANHLAETINSQWRYEEERRRLHDPFPLTLRWTTADNSLTDHWANIRLLPSGKSSGPLNLNGELSKIRETYQRIPSRRLVILGGAGSGKTVLALNLVLNLLDQRRANELVPVIFNLSSWNPTTTTFRGWLVSQLLRDHPGLSGPGTTENLAAELVDRRKILPVLDGFDEMAAGLHTAALKALNNNKMAMILTSRPEEFTAAVRSSDVLTAAAAVEISDLRLKDVASYLPRTSQPSSPGEGSSDWDAVLSELRDHPDEEASANLTAALSTPLMVGLARTIYSDTLDTNPKELLDPDVFGSSAMVEKHLLDAFLPAAYHRPPRRRSAVARITNGYSEGNAHRWLTYLTRKSVQEIAWWKLSHSVAPATALTIYTTLSAIVFGVFFRVDTAVMLAVLCMTAFIIFTKRPPQPAQTDLQLRGFVVALKQEATKGTPGALGEGLLFGGVTGLGFGVLVALNSLDDQVARGFAVGLACVIAGTVAWMGVALRPRVLSKDINTSSAPCPIKMIADDRMCAVIRSLVCGFAAGVPTLSLFDIRHAAEMALAVTIVFALTGTAWGRWILIGRLWLPLTRRLPWNLHAFLDDACERAVLRQSGAVYEFRHIALRDHLRDADDEA